MNLKFNLTIALIITFIVMSGILNGHNIPKNTSTNPFLKDISGYTEKIHHRNKATDKKMRKADKKIFVAEASKSDDELQAVVEETCAYDKQMCTADPESPMARLTNNGGMLGEALLPVLGDSDWKYTDSLYPILVSHEPIEEMTWINAARHIAASPVFLRINSDTDFDTYENVRHCFRVSRKNKVEWISTSGKVKVHNVETNTAIVELLELGWDTLIAFIEIDRRGLGKSDIEPDTTDKVSKMVPINITDSINDCPIIFPVNLQLLVSPDTAGTVSGAGPYAVGDFVIISAEPKYCHYFWRWEDINGNVISNKATDTIEMQQDSIIIAVFRKYEYFLNIIIKPESVGKVTGGMSGLYYCEHNFQLRAELIDDDPNYKFDSWRTSQGEIIRENPLINLILRRDTTVVALFVDTRIEEYDDYYDITIIPNPAKGGEFTILFDSEESQIISVELVDMAGSKIVDIYKGIASYGKQFYRVNERLPSGVYFVKFFIDDKIIVRKVIIE